MVLVFYYGGQEGKQEWKHVAIIVGWRTPTTLGKVEKTPKPWNVALYEDLDCLPYNLQRHLTRPMVVETNGGINYNNARALDNTSGLYETIEIVHIRDSQ